MEGGESAQRGLNLLQIYDPAEVAVSEGGLEQMQRRTVSLGGKNTVQVDKRDRILIFTPGGGGYGPSTGEKKEKGSTGGENGSEAQGDVVVRPVKTSGSLHTYTASQESA